jgi:hypothetical protein
VIELIIDSEREVAASRARRTPPAWQLAEAALRTRWHYLPFVGASTR